MHQALLIPILVLNFKLIKIQLVKDKEDRLKSKDYIDFLRRNHINCMRADGKKLDPQIIADKLLYYIKQRTFEMFLFININILIMKRLAINYSRKFPDHRVEADFKFNKQLMKGPSAYFRLTKDAYNASGVKYFHVWLTAISFTALLVVGVAKFYGEDVRAADFKKTNFPGFKYALLTIRGGYGAYDNILNKFEGEIGGIMDVPFDE